MSRTFTNCGYVVTVEDDRSILVKPGDWISKYSAAIYGTPKSNWDRFKKKVGSEYRPLDDPYKITAGQRVYHPDLLPGETPNGKLPQYPGQRPGRGTDPVGLVPARVRQFFSYLLQVTSPLTDWTLEGSSGIDGSVSFLAGQYAQITVSRKNDPAILTYHAVSLGLAFGPEDLGASLAISPPDFKSLGGIGKFVYAGATLNPDEICGNILIVDFGLGCLVGVSASVMLFGMNAPPQAIARTLGRYFQGGQDSILVLPSLFKGFMINVGPNLTTLSLGASIKMGMMHRWECITG